MNSARCKMYLALAVACLLAGCDDKSKGSATPEAAVQFRELQAEVLELSRAEWMAEARPEEMPAVVQKFIETADTSYTSPKARYSLLHLACMLKKPELARCLLLDGANPNAATESEEGTAETPLLFAISSAYTEQTNPNVINKLVDVLVAGGASLATPGSAETSLTYNACLTCEHEEVYAHLLDIGVPRTGNETAEAAYRGWPGTLERLIQEKGGITEEDYQLLSLAARMSGGYFAGEHLRCAKYLVELGVPVDSTDEAGRTPLFWLASTLPTLSEESGLRDTALEMAVWLLQQGANPQLRADGDEEYPGFSAADLLALNPDNLAKLKEAGVEIAAQPLEIRTGKNLAADVCRAAMLHPPADTIIKHYDTVATLLTPTAEMQEGEMYADAVKNAIVLLAAADAPKTADLLVASPLWNTQADSAGHAHVVDSLINGIQESSLALPSEFLLQKADEMLKRNEHAYAASLIELLGRCPDSDAHIDRLCKDERMPVQAGAWGARLYKEGLPEACDGAVASWLAQQNREADTEVLKKALLLTSLEQIWYGNMTGSQVEEFVKAAKEAGATLAAEAYRTIAANLSNPEALDELMTTQDIWAYELEIATAKYLLQHKDEILSAPQQTDPK